MVILSIFYLSIEINIVMPITMLNIFLLQVSEMQFKYYLYFKAIIINSYYRLLFSRMRSAKILMLKLISVIINFSTVKSTAHNHYGSKTFTGTEVFFFFSVSAALLAKGGNYTVLHSY